MMQIYPQYYPELDSTNRLLKELAHSGAPEGTLVSAARQTAGRGRLRRSFFSPEGGLYFSLLLRPSSAFFETTLITTAAAAAAAAACDKLCGDSLSRIKWVNDIYRPVPGSDAVSPLRKVCGILAEGVLAGSDFSVILGVGINLLTPAEGFPEEISRKAGSLFPVLPEGEDLKSLRKQLTEDFLEAFIPLYQALPDRSFLDEYRSRMLLIGQMVQYEKEGHLHEAAVRGIDNDGALVLTEGGETVRLTAGEVTLRYEP